MCWFVSEVCVCVWVFGLVCVCVLMFVTAGAMWVDDVLAYTVPVHGWLLIDRSNSAAENSSPRVMRLPWDCCPPDTATGTARHLERDIHTHAAHERLHNSSTPRLATNETT